ncbi:hypothetical protein TruAng_003468 [Truncatella angustata]|nr:hypothetical protein TruAng_003468 [Truncatella angustata]
MSCLYGVLFYILLLLVGADASYITPTFGPNSSQLPVHTSTPSDSINDTPSVTSNTENHITLIQNQNGCLEDPLHPDFTFSLLDPNDGIPFINASGSIHKATKIVDPIPHFRFEKPAESSTDNYDLKLSNSYVAINLDGEVVLTTSRSRGWFWADGCGCFMITSVFKYTCEGGILLDAPDIVSSTLVIQHGALVVKRHSPHYNSTTPGNTSSNSIDSVANDTIAHTSRRKSLPHYSLVLLPSLVYRLEVADLGIYTDQHYPDDQTHFTRKDTKPSQSNESRFEGGINVVTGSNFGACHRSYNDCLDTCRRNFMSCKMQYGNCMRNECRKKYCRGLQRWGCLNLASLYEWTAMGTDAKKAVLSSTHKNCECRSVEPQALRANASTSVFHYQDNHESCGDFIQPGNSRDVKKLFDQLAELLNLVTKILDEKYAGLGSQSTIKMNSETVDEAIDDSSHSMVFIGGYIMTAWLCLAIREYFYRTCNQHLFFPEIKTQRASIITRQKDPLVLEKRRQAKKYRRRPYRR